MNARSALFQSDVGVDNSFSLSLPMANEGINGMASGIGIGNTNGIINTNGIVNAHGLVNVNGTNANGLSGIIANAINDEDSAKSDLNNSADPNGDNNTNPNNANHNPNNPSNTIHANFLVTNNINITHNTTNITNQNYMQFLAYAKNGMNTLHKGRTEDAVS